MRTAIHNIPGESGKTNLLQKLVAGVASKRAAVVTNGEGPVTREEFRALTTVVASLIQDVEDATSPDKLAEVFNAALKPLAESPSIQTNGGARPPLALKADRDYLALAPKGDDDITTNAKGPRPPLALKADYAYLAPKGD